MPQSLEFTGERFVPGIAGEIAHEHWHRYAFARRWVDGKRVLDVACGEGYGSALLSQAAAQVVGVDIAEEAVAHARAAYASRPNLRFEHGSATALPLPDASVDVVVSFETIEHLAGPDQPRMLAEIARVLTADGVLVLSAPNPVEYSQATGYRNPFHLHEPEREELDALLAPLFPVRHWYGQRRYFGSAIWSERREPTLRSVVGRHGKRRMRRCRRRPCISWSWRRATPRSRSLREAACRSFRIATTPNCCGWMGRRPRSCGWIGCWASATPRSTGRRRMFATSRTSSAVERDAHRAALTGALQRARRSGAGARVARRPRVRATGCRRALRGDRTSRARARRAGTDHRVPAERPLVAGVAVAARQAVVAEAQMSGAADHA